MYFSYRPNLSAETNAITIPSQQLACTGSVDNAIAPQRQLDPLQDVCAFARPAQLWQLSTGTYRLSELKAPHQSNIDFAGPPLCIGTYKQIYAGICQRRPIVVKCYTNSNMACQSYQWLYQYYQHLLPPMARPIGFWETKSPNAPKATSWSVHPLMYSDMYYATCNFYNVQQQPTRLQFEAMAWLMVQAVGQQLSTLHSNEIGHGDIKLKNMLLHPLVDPYPIVLDDFDFSKYKSDRLGLHGTFPLLAPELLDPSWRGDALTVDVWALVCSTYQLLLGKTIWSVAPHLQLNQKIAHLRALHMDYNNQYRKSPESGRWGEVKHISPAWQHWLANAMHPSPTLRWSIQEAVAALPDVEVIQARQAECFLRQQQQLQQKWLVGAATLPQLRSKVSRAAPNGCRDC